MELKGITWRGRLQYKVIEPPAGSDYKTVSGELNQVMKTLIEPEFDGLFRVSSEDTGISVKNFQFDRYCTCLLYTSDLLLNERVMITLEDETTQEFVRKVLDNNHFLVMGNDYQERKAYSGTVAYIPYLYNAVVQEDGTISAGEIGINYVDALSLIHI